MILLGVSCQVLTLQSPPENAAKPACLSLVDNMDKPYNSTKVCDHMVAFNQCRDGKLDGLAL